ncbi:STAS-like domain-containing protein [Brevundimonas bullata]|jgi:hypothetical protein|uniref:STAS-like domain-containing protein n=1 Tax=Brevundimonas bullata TaxID=13160 RepID=UPI002FDAEACF
MIVLNVPQAFSRYLGGRYRNDGPWSGEAFRDDLLIPTLQDALGRHEQVTIILDGVAGVPSSFLEEAFGGLLRSGRFTLAQLKQVIHFQAEDPELWPYLRLADEFMEQAAQRAH